MDFVEKVTLPLIVIVGPTASGKTSLAIRVAKNFNGEVISADSRAIYRGLDVGTAKPSVSEREGVVHWGIDLVDPGDRFTAADFKEYADKKIAEIRSRGKLPIIAGGTGLYVDSVLYDFQFTAHSNNLDLRKKIEQKTLEELVNYCYKNNISLPKNPKNKRHIVNAIVRNNEPPLKKRHKLSSDVIVVGVSTDRNILKARIEARAKTIVSNTTIEEAKRAASKWGWNSEAMTGNVYRLLKEYFDGRLSLCEVEKKLRTLDWRLAKRQLTWFKRNQEIIWLNLDDAYKFIEQKLASKS